jgi:hypothetical protein
MGTFDIKVTIVYMVGMDIFVTMDVMATNKTYFLVAMVNLITKAPDVSMLTFGATVIKAYNVNWFP